MNQIYLMKNTVQKYDWGSKTAIPSLLGKKTPSRAPWAELWMGTHPKAPSKVRCDHHWVSLIELIKKNPRDILGETVSKKYDSRLPFLFKVLAAAKPLSIQAHPNLVQAKKGFKKENQLKIPLDAYNRNYKDNNHKPECICALTSFCALNGFRKISRILELMEKICSDLLREELDNLKSHRNSTGLKIFFSYLLSLNHDQQQKIILSAVNKAQNFSGSQNGDDAYEWMIKLHANYPCDIGILFPLMLNFIQLEPGQAMFLPAGQLHSYLEGTGIELMANSDNVLRGGLTRKYIDIPELLSVLNFKEKKIDILLPEDLNDFEKIYQTPTQEFALSIISIAGNDVYISPDNRNIEILLCTQGNAIITIPGENHLVPISRGSSVIIPAFVKDYTINGNAKIYKASVPLDNGNRV